METSDLMSSAELQNRGSQLVAARRRHWHTRSPQHTSHGSACSAYCLYFHARPRGVTNGILPCFQSTVPDLSMFSDIVALTSLVSEPFGRAKAAA